MTRKFRLAAQLLRPPAHLAEKHRIVCGGDTFFGEYVEFCVLCGVLTCCCSNIVFMVTRGLLVHMEKVA